MIGYLLTLNLFFSNPVESVRYKDCGTVGIKIGAISGEYQGKLIIFFATLKTCRQGAKGLSLFCLLCGLFSID